MTRLIQLENYPTGDCQRTVFACLLDKEDPRDVPNFMYDGNDDKFWERVNTWLEENKLVYIEISLDDFKNMHSHAIPEGYCTVMGKSPRGDWNHIVIGKVVIDREKQMRWIELVHDTSPYHDGRYLDGEPICIGFLNRKL